MKSAARTKKQPSKVSAKTSRPATPVRWAKKQPPPVSATAAPPTAPTNGTHAPSMPDLTPFGVDSRDAETHVGRCEHCGRAHRHVIKNPKDAMALEFFAKNIGRCLVREKTK